METLLLLILFGSLIGFLGGYAGIGGAPFLIAVLVALLGFSQHEAQGTVLAVMLGPMSLLSVISLWGKVKPNIKAIGLGVVGFGLMSYFGALLAYSVPEFSLKLFFALLLIGLGLNDIFSSNTASSNTKTTVGLLPMFLISSAVGVVGGLFGIGAGVLMVPIFISLFKLEKDTARAISLAVLLPPVSAGAVLKYSQEGAIHWKHALILFICYFCVNYFGGKFGGEHNLTTFKRYFGGIMILLGVVYLYLLFG